MRGREDTDGRGDEIERESVVQLKELQLNSIRDLNCLPL